MLENMKLWPLREHLAGMLQTNWALHRRTRKASVITAQIVVGIYLRYLAERLGAKVRELASYAELETPCAASKFVGAWEACRTGHPSLTLGVLGDRLHYQSTDLQLRKL